jgi:hypothetical protein
MPMTCVTRVLPPESDSRLPTLVERALTVETVAYVEPRDAAVT